MAVVLETEGLTKTFGALAAASDITVRVEEDSVVGLIGGNGAGKTTFLNLITGYLKPTGGRIAYRGRDITALSPPARLPTRCSRASISPGTGPSWLACCRKAPASSSTSPWRW